MKNHLSSKINVIYTITKSITNSLFVLSIIERDNKKFLSKFYKSQG